MPSATARLIRDLRRPEGRAEHGAYLVEGPRLLREALSASVPLRTLVTYSGRWTAASGAAEVAAQAAERGIEIVELDEREFSRAADTVSPAGLIGVAPLPAGPAWPQRWRFALLLDGVRDPGNLGGIWRSAWAAGVDLLVTSPGSVDPYNPKAVRSSMGGCFHVPVVSHVAWPELHARLGSRGGRYCARPGGVAYGKVNWREASLLVVGGEAEGVSADASSLAPDAVAVPMEPGVESLGAAAAAAVLLFEWRRQAVSTEG